VNDTAPTHDTPTVHPTYARMLCMALQRLGLDVDSALQEAGLPPWKQFATSDAFLSQRSANALIAAAVRESGQPWLGIELGGALHISSHGPMGYAAAASRDLSQALETFVRYAVLRYAMLRYRLQPEPNGVAVTLVERIDLGEGRSFILGTMMGILVRVMEAVVGRTLDRIVVDLPFPEPPWCKEIEKVCAGELRFNAHQLTVHLDQETLNLPCITADPRAYAQACLECEQQLSSVAVDSSLSQRVRELIQGNESHYPTLTAVAAYFSLSQRTLIRHLKQEGSSYQDLLDEARQQRALWYLRNTRHTVEEIAQRMGYEDPSNFSRTFRRWFNMTPGEARQNTGGESSRLT
jgi:AraC-like DNA-binding protein